MKKITIVMSLLAIATLVGCKNSSPTSDEKPLCFTCNSASGGSIFFLHAENDEEDFQIQYSYDNNNWTDIDTSNYMYPIVLNSKESVYFRGNNPTGFNTIKDDTLIAEGRFSCFSVVDGDFTLSGNVMSLIKPTGFGTLTEMPCKNCFAGLFDSDMTLDIGGITDASELILPATKLTDYCYYAMFYGCKNLVTVPQLPATELAEYCYYKMFYNCSALENAPDLLAATNQLKLHCYEQMFYGCISLASLKVGFDSVPFVGDYDKYTHEWLEEVSSPEEVNRKFMWKGNAPLGMTRDSSTIPDNGEWDISNW